MSHPDLLSKLLGQSDQLPASQPRRPKVVTVAQSLKARQCAQSPNGIHMSDGLVVGIGLLCKFCGLTY